MRSSRLACASPALLLLVVACGSSDNGPSFAGSVDSATVDIAAQNASTLLSNTLDGVFGSQWIGAPNPEFAAARAPEDPVTRGLALLEHFRALTDLGVGAGPNPLAAPFAAPPQGSATTCVPEVTGLDTLGFAIDADGDQIPDDMTVNYGQGCSTLGSGYLYTLSGSWRIRDTDSGFASYAFTANNFKALLTYVSTGEFASHVVNGTESASFRTDGAAHRLNVNFVSVTQTFSDTGTITTKIAETSSFTPTTGELSLGGLLPVGTFDYHSDLQLLGAQSGGAIPGNFHFLLGTSTPLSYDPACGSEITAGVFRGLLNGKATIGFQDSWAGCGAPTVTVFGTTS